MAKVTREQVVKRLFSDARNYPYGFSRSGDFSINESKALAQYGCLIAALVDGELAPETPEDESYLAAALGSKEPSSVAEKAWLKYQKRINRPKTVSIYGNRSSAAVGDDEVIVDDDDLELELDSD